MILSQKHRSDRFFPTVEAIWSSVWVTVMSGNCPAEWCTYSHRQPQKEKTKQLVASLILFPTSRFFSNRFVYKFLQLFPQWELYSLWSKGWPSQTANSPISEWEGERGLDLIPMQLPQVTPRAATHTENSEHVCVCQWHCKWPWRKKRARHDFYFCSTPAVVFLKSLTFFFKFHIKSWQSFSSLQPHFA